MREKEIFSNGQALGALDSTGVVSTNVFDLELDGAGGNTIIENDQIEVVLNVKILSTTNTSGTQGLDVVLRGSDNANMSTTPEQLGAIHFTQGEIVAGAIRSIKVLKTLATKFLGVFFLATNTSLDNLTSVDCWISPLPDGSPNEDIQKVPSR